MGLIEWSPQALKGLGEISGLFSQELPIGVGYLTNPGMNYSDLGGSDKNFKRVNM